MRVHVIAAVLTAALIPAFRAVSPDAAPPEPAAAASPTTPEHPRRATVYLYLGPAAFNFAAAQLNGFSVADQEAAINSYWTLVDLNFTQTWGTGSVAIAAGETLPEYTDLRGAVEAWLTSIDKPPANWTLGPNIVRSDWRENANVRKHRYTFTVKGGGDPIKPHRRSHVLQELDADDEFCDLATEYVIHADIQIAQAPAARTDRRRARRR